VAARATDGARAISKIWSWEEKKGPFFRAIARAPGTSAEVYSVRPLVSALANAMAHENRRSESYKRKANADKTRAHAHSSRQ
jgi:hypothetical protein